MKLGKLRTMISALEQNMKFKPNMTVEEGEAILKGIHQAKVDKANKKKKTA